MRVLVTGSSGHVGGAVAAHFANRSWETVGLSRTRSENLPATVRQIQADISVPGALDGLAAEIGRCNVVVHAAANLEMAPTVLAVSSTNCLGAHQVLRFAQKAGANVFVFISSVPVVGRPTGRPITESDCPNPPTVYHASKLYGEHLVKHVTRAEMLGVVLRITSPVGPGMPHNRILGKFVKQALANEPLVLHGRGTRRQNYVDVRDVARAVEQCVSAHVEGVYNVAGCEAVSNYDLAKLCIATLGSSAEIAFSGKPDADDDVSWDVSIDKASAVFGYEPQVPLDDSVRAVAAEISSR